MEDYEMTGTPSRIVKTIEETFSVTEPEAELIALSAMYQDQDDEDADEASARNFIVSLDQERAAAVVRNVPVTIRLNGLGLDCVKKCFRKLLYDSATQVMAGTEIFADDSQRKLLAKIGAAILEVVSEHIAWLGTELIRKESFLALLDYTGNEVKEHKQDSIYQVYFTMKDIQKQMKENDPESETSDRDLEQDFALFERKNLIRVACETKDNEKMYQLVF